MSVRLSRSGCISALMFFCWAAGMTGRLPAQDTLSNTPAGSLPPSQPSGRPDALKQLEDELRRSLQSLSPRSSPDSGLAPPYRPPVVVVPDRRARDAEERRKNWLLQDADKSQTRGSERDWLSSPENPLNPKANTKNSLDDFYEGLNQGNAGRLMPRAGDTDRLGFSRSGKTGERTSRDDANLPSTIRDSARRLQDLLNGFSRDSDRFAPSDSGGLSTFLGRNDKELSPDDIKAHKAYMDEYRKVIDGPVRTPSTALMPLTPLSPGSLPPGAAPFTGFDPLTGSARLKPFDTTPGMVTTVRDPGTLPDFNANALNQWNPLYSAPKVEPPKPAPVAVPQAEAPRRRF